MEGLSPKCGHPPFWTTYPKDVSTVGPKVILLLSLQSFCEVLIPFASLSSLHLFHEHNVVEDGQSPGESIVMEQYLR